MNRLIIIGASGHGKVVADIASNYYEEICFLDDGERKSCSSYPVIGKSADYVTYASDSDFFVAIGNARIRQEFMERLMHSEARIATLIHPRAVIAKDVTIGIGSVVMAGAVINPGTTLGKGCIVNTCASIDHDCEISEYVHVAVGAHLAGNIMVGASTWIGAGAIVSNNIRITGDCMIGAGAVVVEDLVESDTYICVPARKMSAVKSGVKM